MAVPPYNWRVPYVVVSGKPGAQLKYLVHAPEELLKRGTQLRLNYTYYINKCINPALNRIFSLCGVDIYGWYDSMVRPKRRLRHLDYKSDIINKFRNELYGSTIMNGENKGTDQRTSSSKQQTMDQFTTQSFCEVCKTNDTEPNKTTCKSCTENKLESLIILTNRLNINEERNQEFTNICINCIYRRVGYSWS